VRPEVVSSLGHDLPREGSWSSMLPCLLPSFFWRRGGQKKSEGSWGFRAPPSPQILSILASQSKQGRMHFCLFLTPHFLTPSQDVRFLSDPNFCQLLLGHTLAMILYSSLPLCSPLLLPSFVTSLICLARCLPACPPLSFALLSLPQSPTAPLAHCLVDWSCA